MKGKIYLLYNSVDDKVYVGSTVSLLCQRIGGHRQKARGGRNSNLYIHMRTIGVSKWTIEAIKIREVKDKEELEKLEFKYMARYPKERLLNMNTEYRKHSKECRRKSSIAHRGNKTEKFKRGSISMSSKCITFKWIEWGGDSSKQRSKSFSIKKYGERNAMKMAKEYQNKIYPKPE